VKDPKGLGKKVGETLIQRFMLNSQNYVNLSRGLLSTICIPNFCP